MSENTKAGSDPTQGLEDTTFALRSDDPRTVENRGGLEATIGATDEGLTNVNPRDEVTGPGGDDAGMTGADMDNVNTEDDAGAAGTGKVNSSQLDLSTTGMLVPDAGPAGAGSVEGSASGVVAPKVEMTDIGLVDVNTADMSEPDGGARVEDEDGNPL